MDAAEERLFIDLSKHINAKLVQWACNSRDLFEMAGLEQREGDAAVLLALLTGVRKVRKMSNLSGADVKFIFSIVEEQVKKEAQHARS